MAKPSIEDQRDKGREMREQVLAELYEAEAEAKAKAEAKARIKQAAGYAVFLCSMPRTS